MEAALARLIKNGGQGLGAESLRQLLAEDGIKAPLARIREYLRSRGQVSEKLGALRNANALAHARRIDVRVPNELHHADLLQLPKDRRMGYALVVVDAASRYKAAEPLPDKKPQNVAAAFEKIYEKTPLEWPERLNVDGGTEFRGVVAKLFEKNKTRVNRGISGDHRHTAFAESANRVIGRRLFAYQHEREEETGRTNREWVQQLPGVVAVMNRLKTRLTGVPPDKAVMQKTVALKPSASHARELARAQKADDFLIAIGSRVRIPLDKPEDGGRWRETDLRFSDKKKVLEYRLLPDRPLEYRVEGDPRWWMKAQLRW